MEPRCPRQDAFFYAHHSFIMKLRSHTASSFVDRPAARRNASHTSPPHSDSLVLAARNQNIRYLQPMGYKEENLDTRVLVFPWKL